MEISLKLLLCCKKFLIIRSIICFAPILCFTYHCVNPTINYSQYDTINSVEMTIRKEVKLPSVSLCFRTKYEKKFRFDIRVNIICYHCNRLKKKN